MIGDSHPVYIIAEAGVNHNGDIGIAKELIDIAAESGADAVKFQTFVSEELILRHAPKAKYHVETTGSDNDLSWFDLLKSQELSLKDHKTLIDYAEQRKIEFASTPYDIPSVNLLNDLDVSFIKIASSDTNNFLLLEHMAKTGKPLILSTAMSTIEEIQNSVNLIRKYGCDQIAVLQCTGNYPAPIAEANLMAMRTIAGQCKVITGYSDHVSNPSVAIAAIAMGAKIYEKHFTLDKSLPGPDHRASIEPDVLKDLNSFFNRLIPDGDPLYDHQAEGPDDMPAHIRSALTQTQLSIPVQENKMVLGIWQGIYLFEHRVDPHKRNVLLHLLGE